MVQQSQVRRSPLRTLAVGAMIGQGVLFLTTLVSARIYGPEEFGRLSLFLAFVSICGPISTLRMDISVGVSRYRRLAYMTTGAIFLAILVIGSFCASIYWLTSYPAFFVPGHSFIAGLALLLGILFAGVQSTLGLLALRDSKPELLSRSNAWQGVSIGCFQIISGLLHIPNGLVYAQLGGRMASLASLSPTLTKEGIQYGLSSFSWKRWKRIIERNRSFVLFSCPAMVANELTAQLPVFLCSHYFGDSAVGIQSLAYRIIATPTLFLAGIFYQGLLTELGPAVRGETGNTRQIISRYERRLFLVAAGILGLSLFASLAVPLLGPSWIRSGGFIFPFGIRFAIYLISFPFEVMASLYEKQSWLLASDGLRVGLIILSFVAGQNLRWSLEAVTWIYCITGSCVSFTMYRLYLGLGRRG